MDSAGNQPPYFGPGFPLYPDLPQLVRVTGPSIGGNIYPCVIQQYYGTLSLRDREVAYVVEPNQVQLSPGIYDCRLIGVYPPPAADGTPSPTQRPLFATTCCLTGGFSSSSSRSA